jgi:hypothetical protein
MAFGLYTMSNGVKSYVKDSPTTRLEFSEHPRDAILFVSQAAASAFLAARPATTLVVLGGTGTTALPMTHDGKSYASRVEN